jgi:hypothetical protein
MTRPPYLRRTAAVVVVVAALAIEFRPATTDRLAVTDIDLPAGATVTEADVSWIEVAPGLEPVELPAIVSRALPAGTPISTADVDAGSVGVPDDWLEIELEVPASAQSGATVVVVMSPAGDRPVPGVVTQPPTAGSFESLRAMVAFAPSDAVTVARAVAEGTVIVLLGR